MRPPMPCRNPKLDLLFEYRWPELTICCGGLEAAANVIRHIYIFTIDLQQLRDDGEWILRTE
jgi:hypothetical protein